MFQKVRLASDKGVHGHRRKPWRGGGRTKAVAAVIIVYMGERQGQGVRRVHVNVATTTTTARLPTMPSREADWASPSF